MATYSFSGVNYTVTINNKNVGGFLLTLWPPYSKVKHKSLLYRVIHLLFLIKKYYIDIIKSYCIEFSIGGFYPYSKSEFHRSRLYYVLSYFDSGHIVHKSKEFIQAADGFFNDFRKEFLIKEPKYTNDFVSKRLIDWIHKNKPKKTIDGTKFLI